MAPETHPDESRFARYLSRELEGEDLEAFEQHVAGCAECAEELIAALRVEQEYEAELLASRRPSIDAERGALHRRRPAELSARRSAADRFAESSAPRSGKRTWVRIAAGFVVLSTATLLAVTGGRSALDRWTPALATRLEGALQRSVAIDRLSLTFADGPAVRFTGLQVGDDPRFSSQSFAQVGGATLRADLRALLSGRLYGIVRFDQPSVRLVRDAGGRWNVASLGDTARDTAISGVSPSVPKRRAGAERAPEAASKSPTERRVRLTAATIQNGTLEFNDLHTRPIDQATRLVLREVDADYSSPDPLRPAAISLQAKLPEQGGEVRLTGEVGPFEGGTAPSYRFSRVELTRLPLESLPGVPTSLSGELSYRGSLASTGREVESLVKAATGSGQLELQTGVIRQRNLATDLLEQLDGAIATGAAERVRMSQILAHSPLSHLLATEETSFTRIGGDVRVAAGALEVSDLGIDSALFRATASGSLARDGALELRGTVTLHAAVLASISPRLPELRALLDEKGELATGFTLAGAWPKIRLGLDLQRALALALERVDPCRASSPWMLFDSCRIGLALPVAPNLMRSRSNLPGSA